MAPEYSQPIVRFAPSPTGLFHVGSARTALFNYLYAQNTGGTLLLRIEDTDRERSKIEFEENILQSLEWLGISYEGALVRQSERTDIYRTYIETLIENGFAYISKEEGGERSEVVRFKNPNKEVTFEDIIRGNITFNTEELGDFVIAKSIEEPLYHLAVVIDDHEMGVTHIIRGEDHISNTPRQILIQEAIDALRPLYAHIPLILGSDKSKLSKRHGATSITEYKKQGYLSEAFFNYLSLLGWSPGNDSEVFSPNEIIKLFSLEKIQKGGAVFNIEKLNWINRQHILKISDEDFLSIVESLLPSDIASLPGYSKEMLERILPVIRERTEVLGDIEHMCNEGEIEYFFEKPNYFFEGLLWKDDTDINIVKRHITKVLELLSEIKKDSFTKDVIKETVWDYASEEGRGSVLWPMRYALSGREKSPDPFELAELLGEEETKERLESALKRIENA